MTSIPPDSGTPANSLIGDIARYLAHLAVERRSSPHTLAAYRRDLKRFAAEVGALPSAEVRSHHVRTFASRLHGHGLAPRSIARHISSVRSLFAYLVQRGELGANPASGIRAPKNRPRLPKTLDVDQTAQLLGAAEAPGTRSSEQSAARTAIELRDRAMAELFYSSGLRLAELVAVDLRHLISPAASSP